MSIKQILNEIGKNGKQAARVLNGASTEIKNRALLKMAESLKQEKNKILEANAKDMEAAKKAGVVGALLDRLLLNEDRIFDMAVSLKEIAKLEDLIGKEVQKWQIENGLLVRRVRAPLGVIGVIYEARPNVTIEAAGLALKTSNAVILRGGSRAINSNNTLVEIMKKAAKNASVPANAIQLIKETSHKMADEFMALKYLDVLIPRGGEKLIEAVVKKAKVPVLWASAGNCHIYIDKDADLKKALPIIINAKVQRPGVCNAMETLLVHKDVAFKFLPKAVEELQKREVEVRGDLKTKEIVSSVEEATENDYYTEFLDLILAVRVVNSLEDAIEHIEKYGTHHSEAIITKDRKAAENFTKQVDSAAVYVNASTRFTDGGQLGLGAEIGISTQKLHVRGPMGLEALTSVKYVIEGDGQIRE